MSETPETDACVSATRGESIFHRCKRLERQRDEALAAATWAVQWLDTLIDRLQHEATIAELFEDMVKVRETNSVLDNEWNRCGWTGTQAARFLKNWRKAERFLKNWRKEEA